MLLVSLTVKLVFIHSMPHLTNLIKAVLFYLMVRLLLVSMEMELKVTLTIQIMVNIHLMLHLKDQAHTLWKFMSEVKQILLLVGPLALMEVKIWQ
jgi:hypothetical protein